MENTVTLLKTMLAQAICLGTQLSTLNYEDRIHGVNATSIRGSLERLRSTTGAFLDEAAFRSVNIDDIFPLYEEIQRVAATRRDR